MISRKSHSEHAHHIKLAMHSRGGHKGGDGSPQQGHHRVDDAVELLEGPRRESAWRACIHVDSVLRPRGSSLGSAGMIVHAMEGLEGLHRPSWMSHRTLRPALCLSTAAMTALPDLDRQSYRGLSGRAKPACSCTLPLDLSSSEVPEASAPLKLGQKIHRKMVPIMAKQSEV